MKYKNTKAWALVGKDKKFHVMDLFTNKKHALEIMERSPLIKEIVHVEIVPLTPPQA